MGRIEGRTGSLKRGKDGRFLPSFSPGQAKAMRRDYANGMTLHELYLKYRVGKWAIKSIIKRLTYKYVS